MDSPDGGRAMGAVPYWREGCALWYIPSPDHTPFAPMRMADSPAQPTLARKLTLVGLVATGVCSMIGVAINTIPFTLQRSVPGIGPNVLAAFVIAAVPALLAGLAYAVLASAMPNAGGTYVYASRALNPYLGFAASFSQWLAISVAMGVVSYMLMPFLRDLALALEWPAVARAFDGGVLRIAIPFALLWAAAFVNIRGVETYQRTVVPLMFLTLAIGAVVIMAGMLYTHADFAAALMAREGIALPASLPAPGSRFPIFAAVPVIFSCFIGFDSIAQAGGEAKDPTRNLPLAILISVVGVAIFYLMFTASVYHAVPWSFVAERSLTQDVTAPGLLGYLLPRPWAVLIAAGVSLALIKDLPAMLMGISRLLFAWAEDGIFPVRVAAVHPVHRTPHVAIMLSTAMASLAVVGCSVANDFLLGIDILVTAMLVNFILMCVSVLALPVRNPAIAARVIVLKSRPLQLLVAGAGVLSLGALLVVHTARDLQAPIPWYLRSTWDWLIVMAIGTAIYLRETRKLRAAGVDVEARFKELPAQ